jgi:hypothetical protein
MHAAVSDLKMAAQRLRLSGELDVPNYTRMMTQLREFGEQLATFERRAGTQNVEPVNLTELIRKVAGPVTTVHAGNEIATGLSEPFIVEGPTEDLRDLLSCLVEFARGVGPDPIDLRLELQCDENRQKCLIGLVIRSSDVPDFLRRKLWDAARARRGEVSITTEPDRGRIAFVLPLERRLTIPA